jgi:hypothetical protein
MGEMLKSYKILVDKPEGKKPLERIRCNLEYNIKINFKGIGFEDVAWIHLAQNRIQ